MTDKDITKLVSQLTQSLATKDDVSGLKADINGLKDHVKRLEHKIDELDQKADTILEFASEVDKTTVDLGKRLKSIETIPSVAHELKLRKGNHS